MPVVEAIGLIKKYGATIALDNVTYVLEKEGLHVILGPNGSGKSTLLSILAGAEKPNRGSVKILGMNPLSENSKLRGLISALLDRTSLHPWIRGVDALRMAAIARGIPWGETKELAERLGITNYWGKAYASYSSGMKRRLLVALALLGFPKVILLDEPFQALDANASVEVLRLMLEAIKKGSTVIVATHTIVPGLLESASTIARMESGKIVAQGRVKEVNASGVDVVVKVECN